MKKGISNCAVAAFHYRYATTDIISRAFAVLPKDAGIVVVRSNPAEERFEFLIGSKEFPENMVASKKRVDFPMIRFIIQDGQITGYEIPNGPPPKRANLQ
jgi:hypothetical protein